MSARLAERALGGIVGWNNARIDAAESGLPNPRSLDGVAWHRSLQGQWPAIRREWDEFSAAGGRLPYIDDVLGEPVDVGGTWRAGLLCAGSRSTLLAERAFPRTLAAVQQIPGLQAAMLSWLAPGTVLHEHAGPNSGVLRYHLGVDCPAGAALQVAGVEHPYVDGEGILFSDRALHSAWNRGDRPRVTLFCEIETAHHGTVGLANRMLQGLLRRNRRRALTLAAANGWDENLNP